jgi:hypothetical protein
MGVDVSKPITITESTNRCFNYLVTAQAALAGYHAGLLTQGSGVAHTFQPGRGISQMCYAEPVEVEVDAAGALDLMSRYPLGWPTTLAIGFHARAGFPLPTASPAGIQRLMASIYEHAFISYFENVRDDIEAKYGRAVQNWPAELSFGRLLRNAFAHGGTIDIRNGATATWRGVSYSTAQNGRHVMYNDLSQSDLTILMLDMDRLL